MDHAMHCEYYIQPLWDSVRPIREQVETGLNAYSKDIRYASKLTISELIENAVKYGTSIEDEVGIKFEFSADNQQIRLSVANKILKRSDYEEVQRHIDQINRTADPETLYHQRLQFLLDDPAQEKSQLGLYRIAYEGKFRLSHHLEHDLLTITAVRTI